MSKKIRIESTKYRHIGTEEALHQGVKIFSCCSKVSYLLSTLDVSSPGTHDFLIKFNEKLPTMVSYQCQP